MAATTTATAGGNMSLSSIVVFDDMMFLCHHASKVTNASFWNGNPLHSSFSLLMFQICLMFVSSHTVRFLLKPLKQSRLVTDVIGAIILGPTVLGHSAAFTSTAFPARGTVILRTFGILGLVYFIFIIGIKMDTKLINLSDRKSLLISSTNVLLPFIATMSAHRLLSPYLTGSLAHPSVFVFVAITISLTLFPNVIHILSELKLLNTELAQLSTSCAMLNASVGWLFIVLFIFLRERAVNPAQSIKAMACVIVIIAFIAYVYHPWATRVTRRTPNGGRVRDGYVFAIILFAPLVGLCFDAVGGSMADGVLFLGLATPDGPPLGSAIVEKIEAIVGEVLMPLMMLLCGLEFDLFQVQDWRTFGIVMVLLFTAYIGKLVGTLLPCLYCKMSFRSSLVFSLVMGFKGTIELFYYMWWLNQKFIDQKIYAMLLLCTMMMTAISTPLVSILHEPMWRLSRSSACTVQNCLPGMELRVLACVNDDDVAPSILNLLEAANPTPDNPICVYLLRLVQLVGRSAPIFIAHRNPKGAVDSIASTVPLFKAFMKYERSKAGAVVVQPFTSVAPFETMHHDACALASERRVSLVIIPFHHRLDGDVDQALRSITPRVLSDAPCSVGILFDRGLSCPLGPLLCHVGVVFFGGHDDREALALASRMAGHPGVVLTVMRFLPSVEGDEKDEAVEEDEEAIKQFKAGVKGGERVVYRDVVVKGVEETVEVIRMANDGWELVVVGRRRGAKSRLTDGLTEWSQWPELGVIGDVLSSSDFGSSWSVLVVQQHV